MFVEEAVCILQGYLDSFGYALHSNQFWMLSVLVFPFSGWI